MLAVGGRERNADAQTDHHLTTVYFIRRADEFDETRGQRRNIRRLGGGHLHNGKLVAAQPGHEVLAADAVTHTVGRLLQQEVANGVPERIVDVLEVVEIET